MDRKPATGPRQLLILVLAAFAGPGAIPAEEEPAKPQTSVYSLSTVVVYNSAVPESKGVAEYYARARGIGADYLVGVTAPPSEEISRSEFESTIREPLRKAFLQNDWWHATLDPARGMTVGLNRIHIVVLVYGMPLKVRDDTPPPAPVVDAKSGAEVVPPRSPFATSGCSVDSELALLADFTHPRQGAIPNPYFDGASAFYQARPSQMMLVGRIDGPTAEIARNLVRDAIATERKGLWGYAYIDEANKIKEGDAWLRESAERIASEGYPVVLDRNPARFPSNYPMDYAALYFGWYTENADGPFLSPSFRFLPGAVACHLHSFSGATLRSDSKHWVGPLLARGAAAVLGNVYEPYLKGTHHFDIFNDRLLRGFCFIEAAYASAGSLSWMNIAVGDPLYRPFEAANRYDRASYSKDADADLKALRLATRRWSQDDPEQFHREALDAAAKLKSGRILEALALAAANRNDFEDAAVWFAKALEEFTRGRDQLRVQFHRVDLARRLGRKDEAVALLEFLLSRLGSTPERAAAEEILEDLRPPLPPPPPAPSGSSPASGR